MLVNALEGYMKMYNHSSHLVKHEVETDHLPVDTVDFEVIGSRYHNNACRRKIAETLLVKKLIPISKKNRSH